MDNKDTLKEPESSSQFFVAVLDQIVVVCWISAPCSGEVFRRFGGMY